jgi:cystathionine beta-synthase
MIRINKLAKEEGIKCELLVKCEYRNPGGSLKDRVVMKMIREAEERGDLTPGMTIIEPTSGNTGISVAMAGAVLGYKTVLCINDKMSKEKVDIMSALGATVLRASKLAHEHSPDSHIGLAKRLQKIIPNSFILNQYYNSANPRAHYDGTAQEIIDDCGGRLDVVVVGAGTSGTLTGIGRKMKDVLPHVKVIGVDPEGSLLDPNSDPKTKTTNPGLVEGIGHKFLPGVLDRSVVDEWVKIRDVESFEMARRIIRTEGLMVGGSSGAVLWAAIQIAKKMDENQRCVVVLADGIRNYLTHFVCNNWMTQRGYDYTEPVNQQVWRRVPLRQRSTYITTPTLGMSIEHGVKAMHERNVNTMIIQDEQAHIRGLVTSSNIEYVISSGMAAPTMPLHEYVFPAFGILVDNDDLTLGQIGDAFKSYPIMVLVKGDRPLPTRANLNIDDVSSIVDADTFMAQVVEATNAAPGFEDED